MKNTILVSALLCLFHTILIAQWTSLNGPYGGYVTELESNDDYVFANKANGLYRSADAGLNWERCDTASYYSTAIHHQHLLRRTDLLQSFRLRYSSDNGDHWQEIPLPNQVDLTYNFTVKGDVILFTHSSKLYRSDDMGQNWQAFQINAEPFHSYSFLITIGNRIYLGNRTRLLYSEDGLNWNLLSVINSTQEEHFTSLYQKDSLILAQISNIVWRSLDGGLNWEETTSPSAGGFVGYMPADFIGINDTLFASNSGKLLRSVDNGLTWTFANADGTSYDNLTSFENVILGGAVGDGVYKSTDMGQSFQPSTNNLQGGYVWALALKNNDLWLTEYEGISKLDVTQIEWNEPIIHKTYWGYRIYPLPTAIVAIENYGPIIRSLDDGQSWDTISTTNALYATESAKIEKKGDTLFLINGFTQLYQTIDLGDHWELVSPNINPHIDGSLRDITVQGAKVFFTNWKSIFRSDDNLQTWQLAGDSLPFGQSTTAIRLFSTPNFLFAWVNEKQLYISDNEGKTWALALLPSSQFNIGSDSKVQFAEIGNTLLGLFDWEGIFISDDSGQHWEYFHEGLPNPIHVTEFTFNDSTLWLGTRDFGLFKRSISDLTTVSTTQPFLEKNIFKIFPNPTKGIFSCKLPAEISGEATISVFDLQGKLIFRRTESSEHFQNIDLSPCTTGVYWVQIATTKGVFGEKVIIQ